MASLNKSTQIYVEFNESYMFDNVLSHWTFISIKSTDLYVYLSLKLSRKSVSIVSWLFDFFSERFVNHFLNLFLLLCRSEFRNGHMLTHRNKKPYECKAEGCGKSYCDARSLRRHTENHHSTVATAPTTPNQSISSTGPLGGLSLSPATASGKLLEYFILAYWACISTKH